MPDLEGVNPLGAFLHRYQAAEEKLQQNFVLGVFLLLGNLQPLGQHRPARFGYRIEIPLRALALLADPLGHQPLLLQLGQSGINLPVADFPEACDHVIRPFFDIVAA
ncbi:hypothetical protein D3C76_1566390 [compost metagenome]